MVNEPNKKSENFIEFLRGYKAVRRMGSTPILPRKNYERELCGNISYQKGGEQVIEKLELDKAYELAQKKLERKITNIQIDPKDKGKIAAAIYRSLDAALNPKLNDNVKIHYAREAIGGMYLLDLTENRTLLNKMYKGFNLTKEGSLMPVNGIVGHAFNKLYDEFGLLEKKKDVWNLDENCYKTIEKILGKEDKESIPPLPAFKQRSRQLYS